MTGASISLAASMMAWICSMLFTLNAARPYRFSAAWSSKRRIGTNGIIHSVRRRTGLWGRYTTGAAGVRRSAVEGEAVGKRPHLGVILSHRRVAGHDDLHLAPANAEHNRRPAVLAGARDQPVGLAAAERRRVVL